MAAQRGPVRAAAEGKRCEGGGGAASALHGLQQARRAQGLFILSSYLNNKTKPVKACLHFRGHEEAEGCEQALPTSF